MTLPEFVGEGRSVRSDDHVGCFPQRRVVWERLFFKDIERSAGNAVLAQCVQKRHLINERAPADVDQISVRLHLQQPIAVNQGTRARGQRRGQHYIIRNTKHFVQFICNKNFRDACMVRLVGARGPQPPSCRARRRVSPFPGRCSPDRQAPASRRQLHADAATRARSGPAPTCSPADSERRMEAASPARAPELDVDHPAAPALGHLRTGHLHQVHRRHHVQVPLGLPVGVLELVERLDLRRACVVDQNVDAAEAGLALGHDPLGGAGLGHVGPESLAAGDRQHVCALLRQQPGHRRADAAAVHRDHACLALQTQIHVLHSAALKQDATDVEGSSGGWLPCPDPCCMPF